MPKSYWVTWYTSVSDPDAHSRYAELAGPAIHAHGGRFLVRGRPSASPEGHNNERAVVIEFDTMEAALAAYHSPAYQAALRLIENCTQREVRLFEAPAGLAGSS